MTARRRRAGKAGGRGEGRAQADSPAHGPWRLRFSRQILDEDLPALGHDAYARARRAIEKKLRLDPQQYGTGLRPPLTGLYKLKSSHVRIFYHIEPAEREVWILMIADRDTIWDRHEADILSRLERMSEDHPSDSPGSS